MCLMKWLPIYHGAAPGLLQVAQRPIAVSDPVPDPRSFPLTRKPGSGFSAASVNEEAGTDRLHSTGDQQGWRKF